jgi:predicted  nucleic acid-binding Zn-ribbon protein
LRFEKQYMAYKEKLKLALKEIKDLKTLAVHDASGSSLQSEMNELRFDKEALESKLRKYAAHCQRLEDDKSGIIDALRSCNRDHGDVGDINQAIVSLCDKLASLEQECETLTQAGRASDSESNIHRLRNENSVLIQKVTEYKERLAAFKKEGAKLHQDAENAHSDAKDTDSEKERKLRFLEQENLQLMLDMKSTKKQLQTAREDLELLRINGGDGEPTLDFGAVGLMSSSSRSLVDKDEIASVNSKSPPSNTHSVSKKPLQRTQNSSAALSPNRKRRNLSSEIPEDKENESSQVRRDTPSASAKKRRVLGPGSEKKNKRAVPGLGEANQESEENPAECAQS